MANEKGIQKFEISAAGSLGLLAYGDIGLRKWREVKINAKTINENKDIDEKK